MKFLNESLVLALLLCLGAGSVFGELPENNESVVDVACESNCIDDPVAVSTNCEDRTIRITQHLTEQIDRCLMVYPKEILYGDTVYLAWNDINTTDQIEPIKMYKYFDISTAEITVSCDKIEPPTALYQEDSSSCRLLPDLNDVFRKWTGGAPLYLNDTYRCFDKRFVAAGQDCNQCALALEFPPLEDWNKPFWRAIRDVMTPEGIKCQVELKYQEKIFNFDIVIKPRTSKEMDLLNQWFANTPSELLPCIEMDAPLRHKIIKARKYFSEYYIDCTPIELSNGIFPLCYFTRYSYRKPGDNNNPSSLVEWRKLEESLQPSTLRDEIIFIVKELEYYDAEDGAACRSALDALITWIRSRPEAQRLVFTDIIVGRFEHSYEDEKNKIRYDQVYRASQIQNGSGNYNVGAYQNNLPSNQGSENNNDAIDENKNDSKNLKRFLVSVFHDGHCAYPQWSDPNNPYNVVINDSEVMRRFSYRLRELAMQLDYMKVRDIEEPNIKKRFDDVYEEKFLLRMKEEDPARWRKYLNEYKGVTYFEEITGDKERKEDRVQEREDRVLIDYDDNDLSFEL